MGNEIKYESQKSWGMIGLTRITGGNPHLFGSNVTNNVKMRLAIKQARKERNLCNDWYGGEGAPLIEVEMSPNQFSEMLINPNYGDGIPCTITYTKQDGYIKHQPENLKIETIKKEQDDSLNLFRERLKNAELEIQDLIKNKKVSKSATENLAFMILKMKQDLELNLSFMAEQQQKEINNMVLEAKSQIENFIDYKIHGKGMELLQEGFKAPLIGEGKEVNEQGDCI